MVKVKICGITNTEDYYNALLFGADYIGFNFYYNSPRFVRLEQVLTFPKNTFFEHKRVGVFVNEKIDNIRKIFETAELDIVQLHGDETPEFCEKLKLPYWKAIRIKNQESLTDIYRYSSEVILVDSYLNTKYGGTGKQIHLLLIEDVLKINKKIFVAGGISNENVSKIIKLKPFGIDINSAIEIYPGKKDIKKMEIIMRKIKG